jgi:hypothetical protein
MVTGENTRAVRLRKQCGVRMITGNPLPPPQNYPLHGERVPKAPGAGCLYSLDCLEEEFSETGLPVLEVALILLPTVTHP